MQNPGVLQGILIFSLWCFLTPIRADMLSAIASFSLTEESPIPLILGNVLASLQARATLHDAIRDILIFPSTQPFSEYFQLVHKRQGNQLLASSELQLIKAFDLETACKKRLTMQQCSQANFGCCCDSHDLFCSIKLQLAVRVEGDIFHTAAQQTPLKVFLIEIKIFDENDQAPVFTPNSFTLKISEGVKHNEKYRLPLAKDGDLGQNSNVFYSLAYIQGRAPNSKKWLSIPETNAFFSISTSPESLSLSIDGDLDREEIEQYKILIEAKDKAINPNLQKTGTLTVSVTVTDVNDVSPMFKSQNLRVSVQENSINGTVICTIMAKDHDSGPNGQIQYSISPSYRESPFRIDSNSGLLTVAGEIDREKTDEYNIVVEATDMGSPVRTSTLPVYIKVTDINDNSPDISINSIFMDSNHSLSTAVLKISEGVPVGIPIANVSVSDLDASGNSTLFCSILNEGYRLRLTSPNTYSLLLANQLDYETERTLNLTLSCQDFGEPHSLSSHTVIEIIVLNENDNPPVLLEPLVIPPAWLVNNSEITKFSAILSEVDGAKWIEESLKGFTVFLPKSFPVSDAFLRFKAKDADLEQESDENEDGLHFSMNILSEHRFQTEPGPFPIVNSGNPVLFSFSEQTREVFLTSTPHFDGIVCVFKAEITVQDGNFSSSKNFTFIAGESNHNTPVVRIFNFALANSLSPYQIFDQDQNGSVKETSFYIPHQSKSNSMIGQVVGSDSDPGQAGKLTYNLSLPQSRCMNLSINSSTGILTLLGVSDNFTTECQLQGALNVTDNGFPKRFASLLITFRLFNVNQLALTIRINQSIILSQLNENNETEWYFNAIDPKSDGALFQLAALTIPGLMEYAFRAKFCALSADTPNSLQGVSVDENSGLVYAANSSFANQSIAFYITISNIFWPSLPAKILKVNLTASAYEANDVRVTEVDSIDCQVEYILDVEPGLYRRNFITLCISVLAVVIILCLLIIILVILLKNSRRLNILSLSSVLKKKQHPPNIYDKSNFQLNSVEVNEPVDFNEEYETCLQTKISAYEISPKDVNNSPILLKTTQCQSTAGTVRIGGGRVSTIALKQLPSVHPVVSDIGNTYYIMENIHQSDLNPKLHSPRESPPVHSNLSPANGRKTKSESNAMPGHANVNIIVHNDFEKNSPMHKVNTLNSNDKTSKVFRIAPNISPIGSRRSPIMIKLDPSSIRYIKEKTPCE